MGSQDCLGRLGCGNCVNTEEEDNTGRRRAMQIRSMFLRCVTLINTKNRFSVSDLKRAPERFEEKLFFFFFSKFDFFEAFFSNSGARGGEKCLRFMCCRLLGVANGSTIKHVSHS